MRRSYGSVLVVITLVIQSACRHHPPEMVGGCSGPTELVGPRGHLVLARSASPDSSLAGKDTGRLVVLLTWSSDSLARISRPYGGILEITDVRTQRATSATVDAVGNVAVSVSDTSDTYVIRVRSMGAQPLQDTVVLRRGYADTARAFLQSGGTIFCA